MAYFFMRTLWQLTGYIVLEGMDINLHEDLQLASVSFPHLHHTTLGVANSRQPIYSSRLSKLISKKKKKESCGNSTNPYPES